MATAKDLCVHGQRLVEAADQRIPLIEERRHAELRGGREDTPDNVIRHSREAGAGRAGEPIARIAPCCMRRSKNVYGRVYVLY